MGKYAVLIGNSQFPEESQLSTLRCPENDVKGMQEILEDTNFGSFNTVVPLVNKSLNEIIGGIQDAGTGLRLFIKNKKSYLSMC